MTIKGGASQETVFQTVQLLMKEGISVEEAIAKVESKFYCHLPELIKNLIRQECK